MTEPKDEAKDEKPKRQFYDVEKFRAAYAETLHRRGVFGRFVGRIEWGLSSASGFLAILIAPLIVFGTVFGVVYSLYISPLVFFAVFGAMIGGLVLYADRKVGSSLQFGDYNLLRRTLAQILGFSLAAGFVLFFLFLGSFHLPSFHLPW
jgi:hypothetical protein